MVLSRQHLAVILNALAGEARSAGGWERPVWNRRVEESLVRLGIMAGYKTCASGVPRASGNTWGEWLYDVTWLETEPSFWVRRVPLVAEIEWGTRWEVWEDFQKLPIVQADVRVLICDAHPGLIADCQQQIQQFAGHHEATYLFVIFRDRRFTVEEFAPA